MAGAVGAAVSMVIATDVDAADSFPAASVALAVSVYVTPLLKASPGAGEALQAPDPSAVVVMIRFEPS